VILRTVIESIEVSSKVDAEGKIYPRLDEAFSALKWWLSHDPESGELIDDYHWLYKQGGDKRKKIPALVAIYTFDHDSVEILALLVKLPHL
jgi:hypothetical protein